MCVNALAGDSDLARAVDPTASPGVRRLLVQVVSARPLLRAGIVAALREADRGLDIRRTELDGPPDVVAFDVDDLVLASAETQLRSWVGTPGLVVLALASVHPVLTRRALALGAARAVTMDACGADLVQAVVEVAGVRSVPRSTDWSVERTRGAGLGRDVGAELSPREREVLGGIAAGLSNEEIGQRLYIGMNTVKTHIRLAYRKIGVTSRSQAVRWVLLHREDDGVRTQPASDPGAS